MIPCANPAGHVSERLTLVASDGPEFATWITYVQVTPSPAVTLDTPSLFVTERSAEVATESVSEAVLLRLFGSATGLETVAVFVWLPVVELGTVKFTITVAKACAGI